ncbi:kinase [Fervidicella metallireducens AeB]|uniref:Kinase n=1 Tax=Fervidicella metallireducens AeB TaxID=1403537 RepID=A0A017RX09_9CLOT|nr:kinase [Fervidicella metallireducens]EYE89222.1 kinase [Fervidicella metallireducens AeB]
MEKTTYYPGSLGEIIQGKIEGKALLISCPINLFTKVKIFETKEPKNKFEFSKSKKLMENLLEKWGYIEFINYLDIEISSEIPKGKGFASSTADLCGTYHSLIKFFNREADVAELMEECIKIEPTDSIIFNKLTLFDYKEGKFYREIGNYMECYFLVYEGNNIVDTITFNNSNIPELSNLDDIFPLVKRAVENKDIRALGKASTISILRNQKRLYYDVLNIVEVVKQKTGGLGILGGHSGDVLAVMYDDPEKLKMAFKKYKDYIKGYKCYQLKSLRSVNYEDNNDYSTFKW